MNCDTLLHHPHARDGCEGICTFGYAMAWELTDGRAAQMAITPSPTSLNP